MLDVRLANLQMQILVATFVLRCDLDLRDNELRSIDGFMHKPVEIRRRFPEAIFAFVDVRVDTMRNVPEPRNIRTDPI